MFPSSRLNTYKYNLEESNPIPGIVIEEQEKSIHDTNDAESSSVPPADESSDEDLIQLRRSERDHIPRRRVEIEGGDTSSLVLFADGIIQKYKARLVVRGFTQQQGIVYEETFSPVARFETVRTILAVAAQEQWKVYQFDVMSAFLNGELEEEVNVSQPPGFESNYEPSKVPHLRKALYGLKQAPRAWLGYLCHRKKYMDDTLKKFNMHGCKIASTLMNANEKFKAEDETGLADASMYRSLVGRLIYLTHSRPDISYVVGVVSRFMHRPTRHHLGETKRILHYLAGTKDYGMWFCRTNNFKLKGFTDSDGAGCMDDMRSTYGNCFTLGTAAISWSSKKQTSVALSPLKPTVRVLSSSGVAPYNDATLEDLKNKHPLKTPPLLPHISIDHHHLVASLDVVLDRIKSFPHGTSCGRDGLHAQHLMDCLSGAAIDIFYELVSSITQVELLLLSVFIRFFTFLNIFVRLYTF
uniref:Putative disease resistance RPP13-like protein 1 n=1 Tax=Tanacetum cinerariifolium TaxID=118510 RepID=A0A6L2JSB2_TANCI|nr:putative disease resistance RPP13-like protein 1 [Tanacetum cinerariifolium]